ncbi:SPOR domain-containing protein [Methylomicrobium sp. Wu6]|uniref:SPOR domain-containing protein n=1 Tax=Methylomicrobium sp. Wu6 TaxID=3107928 RepID=UPI002DD6471A|nr:SPOR domain-containing protein [Methylomicrobium sp. Wu6]MEC4749696.1 SPOR domain-containing protein [Methylomicrobium sp. Wu6]
MVEIDGDTYQVKTVRSEGKAASLRFLMTPERSQNLELLQHLLANTEQAIVLCGPEGVGKTAFLEVLQKRLKDEWSWCMMKGHGGMTFEEVHDRVGPLVARLKPEVPVRNTGYDRTPDSRKDVVLVIDDAGELAPGLLTRLIQLAEKHSNLRALFVLTHDQWHVKNCSDPVIENCFIVEAKPLLQKECRDFVQHIASHSVSPRFGKGLTDDVLDVVYRESHGIPAKMIAHFPELNKPKESVDSLTFLIVAVVCLVSLAFYIQWFTASRPADQNNAATVQSGASKAYSDLRQPILSLPVGGLLQGSQDPDLPGEQLDGPAPFGKTGQAVGGEQAKLVAVAPAAPAFSNNSAKTPEQQQVLPETATDAAVSPVPSPESAAQVGSGDDSEWLAARPENSYALQLMIISNASAVQAVIARHAELQPDLRFVRRIWKGKEKFVLLYGDFADAESAKNAKKSLPAEFKSSMIRKFGTIRKEFPFMPKP